MPRPNLTPNVCAALSICLLLAQGPALAEGLPWNSPAPAQAGTSPQTLYPREAANIRAGAGTSYNVIGKLAAGQPVQVVGPALGNADWVQLANGGYVAASTLSPTEVAVVQAPRHRRHANQDSVPPIPATTDYPVGACEPYSRVVTIGGRPNQINGTACKQPDGSWKIQNYGAATPVESETPLPPPAPIAVQPQPIYGPPPVMYGPPPVYVAPVPVYPQQDPYWR